MITKEDLDKISAACYRVRSTSSRLGASNSNSVGYRDCIEADHEAIIAFNALIAELYDKVAD